MTASISRMRARLQQRQIAKNKGNQAPAGEIPLQVHHGNDDKTGMLYLRIEPVPGNGVVGFNEQQYEALLDAMVENLANLRFRRQPGAPK